MTIRILVTGSRTWVDRTAVEAAIRAAVGDAQDVVVVHGGARGADSIAAKVAWDLDLEVEEHPAYWDEEGRAAGRLRNQRMVDAGADICLAFPLLGSRGTWDCVRRAEEAGIPVKVHGPERTT